jgi:hypothetical protein
MNQFTFPCRNGAILAFLLGLLLCSPAQLPAQAPVKLQKFQGVVDFSTTPPTLTMEGIASHLGRFTGKGQVAFAPGEQPGTMVGSGPVVLQAANGDLLVGNMTWIMSAPDADNKRATSIHFRWSDFVTFSDGTVVSNTGRFVSKRPPGLVIILTAEERAALLLYVLLRPILR